MAAMGLLVLVAGCTGEARREPEPTPADAPTSTAPQREPDLEPELAPDDPSSEPVRPPSAREAARQLLSAHRAIQDPATSRALLTGAAHSQQLAVRELAAHPGWDDRVARLLPWPVRRDTADTVAATRAFRSMHPVDDTDLPSELPAWRIVRPQPAAELRRYYREAERRYDVDWEYLAAINLVETGFGRIRGTSVAGAQGPMQFIPATWDRYGAGGDVRDPRDAIPAAARLLRDHGFADDAAGSLYHYNNSTAYVRGVTLYAEVMQRRPRAYLGYHQWPIYYLTRRGSILLPEGYAERRPVPVGEWLAGRSS